jgi:cell division protein ZapE
VAVALNAQTQQQMDKLWLALAGAKREQTPTLEINHRPLPTLGVENQTLAASFATLCVDAQPARLHRAFAPVPYRHVI